jgi:microcystin-dependent protein
LAETLTAHYSWTKPDPGASASTWGTTLNQTIDKVDAQVFTNAQAGVPIGTIMMFGGATAPSNWLLCQGQSLATTGTYAALFGVLGYAFGGSGANFNLPNFIQRFPLGAGTNVVGASGGSFNSTISVANLPAHNHPFNQAAHAHNNPNQTPHSHPITDQQHVHAVIDQQHTHDASQAPHNHTVSGTAGPLGAGFAAGSGEQVVIGTTSTQQPAVSITPHTTGITGTDAQFTHITGTQPVNANIGATDAQMIPSTGGPLIGNTGSGTAMTIIPPWVAVNYIIRFA